MLKLPNSIEPAVMAENIVHLRDGLAAVDAKTLPATTSATTGQILKLTGESKTPAWADEYSYTPPAYSETEVNTGQKWIDGKDIYKITKTFSGDDTATSPITKSLSLDVDTIISINGIMINVTDQNLIIPLGVAYDNTTRSIMRYAKNSKQVQITNYFSGKYGGNHVTVYYTKPDPVPGRTQDIPTDEELKEWNERNSDQEPEEKKTTKKKTTK